MDEKLLFCVSISCVKKKVYGPEWKETDGSKTLIDLFLQVCGTEILGQQVQVLISKERSFLEAAVVPVCTPLIVLAEKSQSYIQFILKSENVKLEKLFQAQQHKTSHESSLGRQETFCIKTTDSNWLETVKTNYKSKESSTNVTGSHNGSSYYGLASKPSFEDMTVEEICEEIRRIKTTELSSWRQLEVTDDKQVGVLETSKDTLEKLNKTVPIIMKPVRSTSSSSKRTPSPTPTLTSKLRSLKSAKAKKTNKQSPATTTKSPASVKKEHASASNRSSPIIPNESGGTLLIKATSNGVSNETPTTFPTKSLTAVLTKTPKKPTRQQRIPNTERLSALAQPRRRNSEPIKATQPTIHRTKKGAPTRKSVSLNTKRPSTVTSRAPMKAKSNFVKSPCNSQSTSADYFVEIFTTTTTTTTTESGSPQDKSYDVIETKQKQSEYSSDSLLTHSTDKSSEMSVNDILYELRQSSGGSSTSSTPSKRLASNLDTKMNKVSKEDLSFGNSPDVGNSSRSSGNPARSFFGGANDASHNKSLQQSVDSTDVPSSMRSPQKSPLFTSLLEKNHLKHHSSTSLNNSFEKHLDSKATAPDSNARNLSTLSSELLRTNSSVSQENFNDTSTDFGLSSDVPIDSLSLSTSSKNNEVCAPMDNTNQLKTDIAWSNTRGVKFTGSDKAGAAEQKENTVLNETFVISGKNTQKESAAESTTEIQHPLNLALERRPLANSSPCPPNNIATRTSSDGVRTPDKHIRKHWDNSLKGMDELLIASLQAFSIELRSTTENVASNIRVLYEKWRKENEGTDDDDDIEDNGRNLTANPLSKRSPPPEDAGIQKGIAFVFRNLRKIEVKLKTMEQAAMTMHTTRNEGTKESSKTAIKVPKEKKSMLQRNKSFKWKELKNSARVQARSSTWRQTHPHRSHTDTSSDSDT